MRFIVLLSLLLCSLPSLGAQNKKVPIKKELDISDIDQIEKLTADYSIALDILNFPAVRDIFTPNATFDFSNPKIPLLRGIESIEKQLALLDPPGTISQHTVDTWSIDFSSDKTASGTSYTVVTYFGKNDLAGQVLTIHGYFHDTFIRTSQLGYGGWRINTRVVRFFGKPIGNPDILPNI